jgi:hypothetical protein
MAGDYKFSDAIQQAIADSQARVRVGYPWWLRPFLAHDVVAITLGRTIFLRAGEITHKTNRLLRHELVHVRQVNQLGFLRFLWRYTTEFLRHFRHERNINRAYRKISFEIEANAEEERADV